MGGSIKIFVALFLTALFLSSCSKNYRVRVSNFYYEELDSVIVGKPERFFTEIKHGETTSYQDITSGEHSVRCVTADGATFWGTASLKKGDGGDCTIQIDGLQTIIVLRD